MSPCTWDLEWVPMGSELGPFSRVPQCHPAQGNQSGSLKGVVFWTAIWFPIWNQLGPRKNRVESNHEQFHTDRHRRSKSNYSLLKTAD